MSDILMKCGCVSTGVCTARNGIKYDPPIPICITHDCSVIEENKPSLSGRKSRCSYYGSHCHSEFDSSYNLAFFKYKPESAFDTYYCGCFGWD